MKVENILNAKGTGVRTVRPYDYRDAATLLTDFWAEVYAVLKERGD